jgi:transposase-like protein
MNKRSYRRFTTDEKQMILTEVAQPGVTLSEVCRKHSVSPALVYRRRAVAQQSTTQALPAAEYAQCRWRYHATFPTLAAKGGRRIRSAHGCDLSALRSARQAPTATAEKKRCGTSKTAD